MIVFWPRPVPALFTDFLALPEQERYDGGVRIMTCGDEVCRFRAAHHGVPGATYERAAA